MAYVIDIEGFEECETCGAMILADEDCPVCEEDERKRMPKRPTGLVKRDPKRERKSHNRRKDKYGHRH